MRFGFALPDASESTTEDLSTVIDGCGYATMKLPTPRSKTPSTPSFAVTRTVQPPYAGEAGTVYWYWKTQVAEVVSPQPAAAPCAVMAALVTSVLPPASMMLIVALEISKLPNGSLTCARMNSVLAGFQVPCWAPVLYAAVQVWMLFTLTTVAL